MSDTFNDKRHLLATEQYVTLAHKERAEALGFAQSYGDFALKSLFTLNGGSIIAVLAFLGSFFAKGDGSATLVGVQLARGCVIAFQFFAVSLCFCILSGGLAYINWSLIAEHETDSADAYDFIFGRTRRQRKTYVARLIWPTAVISVLMGLVSLMLWLIGAQMVAASLASIGA